MSGETSGDGHSGRRLTPTPKMGIFDENCLTWEVTELTPGKGAYYVRRSYICHPGSEHLLSLVRFGKI